MSAGEIDDLRTRSKPSSGHLDKSARDRLIVGEISVIVIDDRDQCHR